MEPKVKKDFANGGLGYHELAEATLISRINMYVGTNSQRVVI